MISISSIPRPCSSRPIMAASCHPAAPSGSLGLPDRAGRLPVLSRLDAPQLRLKARAVRGLEPAHVLNAGAGDVDGPVGSLRECIGPAQPLVLYEGGDAIPITDLHCILLNRAQIKPPAPVDPKTVRRLGFGDTLHTSFEVLLGQTWVLQGIRRDAIEGPAGQGFPIERAPIGRERDAVSGKFDPRPSGRRNSCPSVFTTTSFSGWVLG